MAKTTPQLPKAPKELKDLEKYLAGLGYSLAFPFDDIRQPGYIGRLSDLGQEIIVDAGRCLAGVPRNKPGRVAVGSYKKASKFSLKSFLGAFGSLATLDFGAARAKNIELSFPKPLQQTQYLTELDVEEYAAGLTGACRTKATDPGNFVIFQVLQTDSIRYTVNTSAKITTDAKTNLAKQIAQIKDVKVEVSWESEKQFTLDVSGVMLTIGYKIGKVMAVPVTEKVAKVVAMSLSPQEMKAAREAGFAAPRRGSARP